MIPYLLHLVEHGGMGRLEINDHRGYYVSPKHDAATHMPLDIEWVNTVERQVILELGNERESKIPVVKLWLQEEREECVRFFTIGASLPMVLCHGLDRLRVKEQLTVALPALHYHEAAALEGALCYLFNNAYSWALHFNEHVSDEKNDAYEAEVQAEMRDPEGEWIGEEPWTAAYVGARHTIYVYPRTAVAFWRFSGDSVAKLLVHAANVLKQELKETQA